MSAASLASDAVRNKAGEKIGSITDIIIDLPSGRVAYAVLAFGGFLGFGEKLFAIPWQALTLDEDNKCFILEVVKGNLENAPGFDKDNWPDMADSSWSADVHDYYGQKPYWEKDSEALGINSQAPAPAATNDIEEAPFTRNDFKAKDPA